MKADEFLRKGISEMDARKSTYDAPNGERSMGKAVDMYNTLTRGNMSEQEGWLFMALLKMVRSQQGKFKEDNFIDGAAYFGLAGETAHRTENL